MVIKAGPPSEAWKILSSMVGESNRAARHRAKTELEELTIEIGK